MSKTSIGAIAALILISVLLVLYFIGKKSVHTEITVSASPSEVWKALTDLSAVRTWNQVLVPKEGSLEEGYQITYQFYQEPGGEPTEMNAQVDQLVPQQLIQQSGGIWGVLTFKHQYRLEPAGTGTLVTIHETYRGIMVPFWDPAPVEAAYARLLEALRNWLTK